MDIKVENEFIIALCHGCLSTDRNVTRLNEEYREIFYKLRNDKTFEIDKQGLELQLCWECYAFLKKLKIFQAKIKTAQCMLVQYLQSYYIQDEHIKPQCLSALKEVQIDENNYSFITEEGNIINIEYSQSNDSPNSFNENPQDIFEQKEVLIEKENEIKVECDNIIKEEYSNDHDTEYFETEFKIENGDPIEMSCKPKDKHRSKKYRSKTTGVEKVYYYNRRKYEMYATIIKSEDKFKNNIDEFCESAFLSYKEYETFLRKDLLKKNIEHVVVQFKCKECSVGYTRKLDLLRHESFCHNKALFPYNCMACSTTITTADHLDQHWAKVHTIMVKCKLCSEVCRTKAELKKHLNKKHTKLFTCNVCSEEFGLLRQFVKHYKTVHERVVCDYCNMHFTRKTSLITHIRRAHIPAYCVICKRTYRNHKIYRHHNQIHHPELTGEAQTELSYCVECDKQYPSVYKYKRHLHTSPRHTPQKKVRVPCPDCGKIFSRTNFMKNHYRFAHLKVTKNYCEQCDKYYTTGYGLRKHIERVHKKIAPPKDKMCDICGRGFGSNKILINHRRTHTGERPFKCEYCPAAFAQKTAMKTHQKTQHKHIALELAS